MNSRYAFVGGAGGRWRVLSTTAIKGADFNVAKRLDVLPDDGNDLHASASWILRGLISNVRYATRPELNALVATQETLNRMKATRAALIPIKKSSTWWDLAQDERRAIFEGTSHHTAIGMEYVPAIARQLYHCRDIGEAFDFLTWFEYSPEHAAAFEGLVGRLRSTQEWGYVDR